MIQTATLSLALPVTTRSTPAPTGRVAGDFAGSFAQANAGAAADGSAVMLTISASAGPETPLIVATPEDAVRQDIAATGNGLPMPAKPGEPTLHQHRAIVSPTTGPRIATAADTEAPADPLAAAVVAKTRGLKAAPKPAKADPLLPDVAASPSLIASPIDRIDHAVTPDADMSDAERDVAPAGQSTPLTLVPVDLGAETPRTDPAIVPQTVVASPVQGGPQSVSGTVVASPIEHARPVREDLQTVATSPTSPSGDIAHLTGPTSVKRSRPMVEGATMAHAVAPAKDSSPSLTMGGPLTAAPARQPSASAATPALVGKPLVIAPASGTSPAVLTLPNQPSSVVAAAMPQDGGAITPKAPSLVLAAVDKPTLRSETRQAPVPDTRVPFQRERNPVVLTADATIAPLPAPTSAIIAPPPLDEAPALGSPRWIATDATTPVMLVVARPDAVQPQPGTVASAGQVFGAAIQAATKLRDDSKDRIGDAATAIAFGTSPEIKTADIRTAGAQQAPLDMRQERWPHAMIDRIEILRDAVNASDTRIRLIPDALGAIDVSVKREGDTVHVHFNAEQAATRTLLQDAQPRLVELAEARGLKLGQSALQGGTDGGQAGAGQQRAPTASRTPPSPSSSSVTADVAEDTRIA